MTAANEQQFGAAVAQPPSNDSNYASTTRAQTSSAVVPVAAASSNAVVADKSVAPVDSYTPVQSSVTVVKDKLQHNERLLRALSTLQAYLPQRVTDQAVKGAEQLQQLGATYGTPLVARVDGQISNAIVTLLAAPKSVTNYGQAKVQAVDQLAYKLTPESLKPTYTATRTRALSAVQATTNKVVELKRQRADPLYEKLTNSLDQLSKNIAAVRATLTQNAQTLSQNATNAAQSLHVLERLTELQAKVTNAVDVARAKGVRARAVTKDLIASVTDAAQQIPQYIDSNLSEQNAALVRSFLAKIVEGVATLKQTLHIRTPSSSTSTSRSDSNASGSDINFDEVDSKAAAPAVVSPVKEKVAIINNLVPAAAPVAPEEVAPVVLEVAKTSAKKKRDSKKKKKAAEKEEEKQKIADEQS